MPSIFTKIINKEIPSLTIFENEKVLAFMDINPKSLGHILIVPKLEIDYFVDVPDDYYHEVFRVAKFLAPVVQKALDSNRIGMSVYGTEVPHFHLHLFSIHERDGSLSKRMTVSINELTEQAKKIKNAL
jgi:histidine triad (HIT) family protein